MTDQDKELRTNIAQEAANYELAKTIVLVNWKASPSLLQRKLMIGYEEARRLIDRMERDGLVGPLRRNGTREIILSPAAPPPVALGGPSPRSAGLA